METKLAELIVRLGKRKYEGSTVEVGRPYQNIPSYGIDGHRNRTDQRARRIMELVDMTGKTVLDLGCSVGTMSKEFSKCAKSVAGVDYDSDSIDVAKYLYNTNVHFDKTDLTLEYLDTLDHFDVVIWVSQFMWMVKQHGMSYALDFLWKLSTKCDTLVFESAGDKDGSAPIPGVTQSDLFKLLVKNTVFKSIKDCGVWNDGWVPRNVFVCSKPMIQHEGQWSKVTFPSRGLCHKEYKDSPYALELKKRELFCLELLPNSEYVPKVIKSDSTSILMSYEGMRPTWLPENDVRFMTEMLWYSALTHRDISPENLLWNGDNLVLIDFSFATIGNEITDYHYDLGKNYKCPNGFNDEYSLRKIQSELIHEKAS